MALSASWLDMELVPTFMKMIACFRKFNTFVKALFCDIHQFLCFRGDVSYCPGAGCVGMVSLIDRPRIKADDIAIL